MEKIDSPASVIPTFTEKKKQQSILSAHADCPTVASSEKADTFRLGIIDKGDINIIIT